MHTAVVSRFDYLYDKNDNRTQQIETRGTPAVAETTTYAYDAADRLTEVVYPYLFDGLGSVTDLTNLGWQPAGELPVRRLG